MNKYFFVIIFLLLSLLGCDNRNAPDFFKSVGDEVSQVWHFDSIICRYNFNDAFDVFVVKDTVDFAVVTCGKNLMDKIKWYYSDSHTLDFENNNEYRIVRNYHGVPKIELHYSWNDLNIYLNGSCCLSSKDSVDVRRIVFTDRAGSLNVITNSQKFELEVWFGTGRFFVSGKTEEFRCEPRYSSIVDATQLSVKKAFIDNYSTGNVYVNPTDSLIAKIFWTGDIIYTGNPAVKLLENPGKGGLINR